VKGSFWRIVCGHAKGEVAKILVAKISGRFPDIGESFLIFRIYSPISMLD
jgi:hypothetical protein